MRVLHIAEAANPEFVSVPLVGWSQWLALRHCTDSLLVTHIRNREAIERQGFEHGVDFVAINSEAVARPVYRLSQFLGRVGLSGWTLKMALSYVSYWYFERLVWQAFNERIRAGEFDIVHRVTPLSPTIPSFIAKRCAAANVPFVLGPLNGGLPWPKAFRKEQHREREWLAHVRSAYKWLPGYHQTRRFSTALIIGSLATWQDLETEYYEKSFYLPENGIDHETFDITRDRSAVTPWSFIFVGRVVPYKGLHVAIAALAPFLVGGSATLTVVGDGPDLERNRRLASELGVSESVFFKGWQPHSRVPELLSESDVLIFPSIREFGGGVVLESMALGVVPIVADYGGPSELVTDDTGYKIPLGNADEMVSSLGEIVSDMLYVDKQALSVKADACRERVKMKFTWSQKAEQIASVYKSLLVPNRKAPRNLLDPGTPVD